VATTSRAGGGVESFTTFARTKSGERRWIHISILAIADSADQNGPLIMHLFRDASDLKQREWFASQVLSAVQGLQEPVSSHAPPSGGRGDNAELTERELEVLILLTQGLSTAGIADRLSISPSTTRNHIQNILQKLHVHSRAAAVAYAFEHGLVSNR
jgi:DNA-binding NarL/FixJ family response regulator